MDHQSKYMKHKKKDGKFICKYCEKPYSHTRDLKIHYRSQHSEQELKKAGVEVDKAIKFTRKQSRQHGPKTSL